MCAGWGEGSGHTNLLPQCHRKDKQILFTLLLGTFCKASKPSATSLNLYPCLTIKVKSTNGGRSGEPVLHNQTSFPSSLGFGLPANCGSGINPSYPMCTEAAAGPRGNACHLAGSAQPVVHAYKRRPGRTFHLPPSPPAQVINHNGGSPSVESQRSVAPGHLFRISCC